VDGFLADLAGTVDAVTFATERGTHRPAVSLTVNEVSGDTFSVLIIPHTLKVTTFGALPIGARLNLEVDLMARYAARLLEASPTNASR